MCTSLKFQPPYHFSPNSAEQEKNDFHRSPINDDLISVDILGQPQSSLFMEGSRP
jgi:hypothetical protein